MGKVHFRIGDTLHAPIVLCGLYTHEGRVTTDERGVTCRECKDKVKAHIKLEKKKASVKAPTEAHREIAVAKFDRKDWKTEIEGPKAIQAPANLLHNSLMQPLQVIVPTLNLVPALLDAHIRKMERFFK